MRRNLIILLVLFALICIGVAVYFIFFGPSAAHLTATTTPFGENSSPTAPVNYSLPQSEGAGTAGTVVAPDLVEITSNPVSPGEIAMDVETAATTSSTTSTNDVQVNYIDRASGNIYAYMAIARSLTRISDKTLPGIQNASWLPDGSMAFVQFLTDNSDGSENLKTYALPSNTSTQGYFLQDGLDEAQAVGSSSVFTLADSTGNAIGMVIRADDTTSYQLFTSPLTSLIVYPSGNSFVALTRAASEINGYAFSINQKTGALLPILGPLRGLTILPDSSGSQLLYSYTDGTTMHMGVYNIASGSAISLPIATIADKCVWSPDDSELYCAVPTSFSGNLPDDWFQGAVSFSDRIWRIDLSSRIATLVLDPQQVGNVSIDAVNLTLDPQAQVLVFRNKKDSSLWAYTLPQ